MADWQNFYLQKMGTNSGGSSYDVKESVSAWGVFCKTIPFKIADKMKDPAKRSWFDEHGDDEYISQDGLFAESYSMTVEFGCKKLSSSQSSAYGAQAVSNVRTNVGNFLSYLRTSGMMKMYSAHTRIGRQNVRLDSVGDAAQWVNEGGNEFLVFSVTFKVNDPVTDITKTNNGLVVVT